MMVEESILTVLLLGWLFFRFARQDEQRQALVDLAAQRGIELSDERARRAAHAGRTEILRQRLLAGAPVEAAARLQEREGVDERGETDAEPAGPDRPG